MLPCPGKVVYLATLVEQNPDNFGAGVKTPVRHIHYICTFIGFKALKKCKEKIRVATFQKFIPDVIIILYLIGQILPKLLDYVLCERKIKLHKPVFLK